MLEAHHHQQYQYRPLVICLLAGLSFITVCRLRMGSSSTSAAGGPSTPDGGFVGDFVGSGMEWRLGPVVGPYQPLVAANVSSSPLPYDVSALGALDRSQLIDLGNFSFLMNDAAANACQRNTTPMLVTLVHSSPAHQHHRDAIRQVWGSHMNVVFLVGETWDNATQQQQLEAENEVHGDIVQGSFRDTYRNLTYKHVMGLKWVAYHCPQAKYVIKTDDDVFVNTNNLHHFLNERLSPLGVRRLIMCQLWKGSVVKRSYRSKWRVSHEEYAGRFYPGYCPGWAVIYSPDVAMLLYRQAQHTPYFWIDDVHVTGTLVAAVNLTHTPLGEPYLFTDDREVMQRYHNSFLFYLMDQQQFKDLHQVQRSLPFS